MNYNNIDDALAAAKAANYTREQHWQLTAQQASWARDAAAAFHNTDYHETTHNCWHMVFAALEAAGTDAVDDGAHPNKSFNANKHFCDGWSDL